MPNTEILGSWWLPPGPDEDSDYQGLEDTVAGVLRLDESRPWQLTTIGNVDPDKPIYLFQQEVGLRPKSGPSGGPPAKARASACWTPNRQGKSCRPPIPLQGTEQWGVRWYASSKGCWVTPKDTAERVCICFDPIDEWVIDPGANNRAYFPQDHVLELPDSLSYTTEVQDSDLILTVDSATEADWRSFEARRSTTFKIDTPLRLEDLLDKWITPLRLLVDVAGGIPTTVASISFTHAELSRTAKPSLQHACPNVEATTELGLT